MEKPKLTFLERDALTETASICAGNVSTVLSNLVMEEIKLDVSNVDIFPIEEIQKLIAKGEKLVIGPKMMVIEIYAPLTGDLNGNMLTLFPKDNALFLLDLAKKAKLGTTKLLGKEEMSKLKEVGDGILSIYTQQISTFLGLKIKSGESRIISTFGELIMDFALSGVDVKTKYVLILRTDFSIITKIKGSFVVLLALEKLDDFLNIIRKKVGEVK